MRRKFRSSISMMACVALCLLAACSRGPSGSRPAVGQPITNFTLNGVDGKPFNIADQKGKVVLINVFTTW